MKQIQTQNAPAAVGPYSQAVEHNGTVYCSGQIGLDPSTGQLVDGLENQVHQIMKNISAVLEASSLSLENVIKTTVFLADINDYAKMNEVYGSYFASHKPARSAVQVAALPKGAAVEIEIVAVK